jgi:non-homologous end joining protein Ku
MLIEAADGKVDRMACPDQAAQELKALIDAKLAGQAATVSSPAPTILPLLEALKKSVGAARPFRRLGVRSAANRLRWWSGSVVRLCPSRNMRGTEKL